MSDLEQTILAEVKALRKRQTTGLVISILTLLLVGVIGGIVLWKTFDSSTTTPTLAQPPRAGVTPPTFFTPPTNLSIPPPPGAFLPPPPPPQFLQRPSLQTVPKPVYDSSKGYNPSMPTNLVNPTRSPPPLPPLEPLPVNNKRNHKKPQESLDAFSSNENDHGEQDLSDFFTSDGDAPDSAIITPTPSYQQPSLPQHLQ
jgi:hypothetical protein